MTKLQELIQEIRFELGTGFIATDIVNAKDGISIAGLVASSALDTEEFAARFSMVVKLATRVTDKIEIGEVEDMLTTTQSGYLITRLIGDGSYFWSLAVSQDATLGMVRVIMNDYENKLWDAIPK